MCPYSDTSGVQYALDSLLAFKSCNQPDTSKIYNAWYFNNNGIDSSAAGKDTISPFCTSYFRRSGGRYGQGDGYFYSIGSTEYSMSGLPYKFFNKQTAWTIAFDLYLQDTLTGAQTLFWIRSGNNDSILFVQSVYEVFVVSLKKTAASVATPYFRTTGAFTRTNGNLGRWMHVDIVYNGALDSANIGKIYFDGTKTSDLIIGNLPTVMWDSSTVALQPIQSTFNGRIDNVRMIRRAITQTEAANMTAASRETYSLDTCNGYLYPDTSWTNSGIAVDTILIFRATGDTIKSIGYSDTINIRSFYSIPTSKKDTLYAIAANLTARGPTVSKIVWISIPSSSRARNVAGGFAVGVFIGLGAFAGAAYRRRR
jgi:hypothetical protein